MPIFGKKSDPAAGAGKPVKPGVTFGKLVSLDIGGSIRPLGQTGAMLTYLIALIFSSYGLFPRNHPVLVGAPGARVTLNQLMRSGWHNLSFTREGLVPVIIYFAVIASVISSVFGLIFVALFIFTGTAHAQSFSFPVGAQMFQPVDPTQDIAIGWLNYIFFGTLPVNYLGALNQTIPTFPFIQLAFIAALAFFSDAVLVVAAIVLFYHLASMTAETAHHGVAMGKRANQIWAPIRLVAAIGLLVPINYGLNSGQYIVLQITAWGSGFGSQLWNVFLQALVEENYRFVPAVSPEVRRVATDMVLMEACTYAYNQMVQNEINSKGAITVRQIPDPPQGIPDASGIGSAVYSFSPPDENEDQGLCGRYSSPPNMRMSSTSTAVEQQIANALRQASVTAFNTMQNNARNFAQTSMKAMMPQEDGGTLGSQLQINNAFEDIITAYMASLQGSIQGAMGNLTNPMAAIADMSARQGWVTAGSWWNTIARIQGEIANFPREFLPKTTAPQLVNSLNENNFQPNHINYRLAQFMGDYMKWLEREQIGVTPGTGGLTPDQREVALLQAGLTQDAGTKKHILDSIFIFIDAIASINGVWHPANGSGNGQFTLGVQFTTYNPLAELANFGHANINTAFDLFDAFVVLQTAGSAIKGVGGAFITGMSVAQESPLKAILGGIGGLEKAVGQLTMALGSIFMMLTMVFFTVGFMLAYFLPMVPFFRFMLGIVGWFINIFEAVVCAPLVALAHLTPYGDGLPGEKAKAAYYFIFDLFLRPALMVLGLVVAFLLVWLVASILNLLYMQAVIGAGALGFGHVAMARLIYTALYVAIMYMCGNNAFKMIEIIPRQALSWMGAQGMHHEQLADVNEIGTVAAGASGFLEQKIGATTREAIGASHGMAGAALMHYGEGIRDSTAGAIETLGRITGKLGVTMGPASIAELKSDIKSAKEGGGSAPAGDETPTPAPPPPPGGGGGSGGH